jgi:hypothetical protein
MKSVSSPHGMSSTVTNVFTLFVSGPVHVKISLRGRSTQLPYPARPPRKALAHVIHGQDRHASRRRRRGVCVSARASSCLDSAARDEWLRTDRNRLSHLKSAKRVDHLNLFRRGAGPGRIEHVVRIAVKTFVGRKTAQALQNPSRTSRRRPEQFASRNPSCKRRRDGVHIQLGHSRPRPADALGA